MTSSSQSVKIIRLHECDRNDDKAWTFAPFFSKPFLYTGGPRYLRS